MIRYLPFVSLNGDRKVSAKLFRKYWESFATNGILKGLENECQCRTNGMSITIGTGVVLINGTIGIVESEETVAVTSISSARHATVVLEFNDNSAYRNIRAAIVYGTGAAMPTLTQTAEVWQLPLCSFVVPANATTLSSVSLADMREYAMLRLVNDNVGKAIKSISCVSRTPSGKLLGDANGDGKLDKSDVTAISQYRVGLVDIDTEAADLNGDGVVNNADLIDATKLIENLPEGQVIARYTITYVDGATDTFYGYISATNGGTSGITEADKQAIVNEVLSHFTNVSEVAR